MGLFRTWSAGYIKALYPVTLKSLSNPAWCVAEITPGAIPSRGIFLSASRKTRSNSAFSARTKSGIPGQGAACSAITPR